jgi:hypothetical protein
MQQPHLGLPDLLAEPAVALRLPRLFLQRLDLCRQGRGYIG